MWILLKLGVSKLYARYFKILISEYSIDQMELNLKTAEYEMDFIANGYLFERQLIFFENLNYENKLKTIINKYLLSIKILALQQHHHYLHQQNHYLHDYDYKKLLHQQPQ